MVTRKGNSLTRAGSPPKPPIGTFVADTTPTKDAVVGGLTHDATIDECIFDLIDNAVDAARNDLIQKKSPEFDDYGLPARYDGYKIRLNVHAGKLNVADNCGGINATIIKDVAFRFGKRSSHPFGIGTYGVGLNRAIFRLGKKVTIETNDGSHAYQLSIDSKSYIASDSWDVPVKPLRKKKLTAGTTLLITLAADVAADLASPTRLQNIAKRAEWRYAHILKKGFEIEIDDKSLRQKLIQFRGDSAFTKRNYDYPDDGVHVFIEFGEHHHHRFKKESGWTEKRSRQSTSEYGWNVTCNDRTILIADRSQQTGWPAVWHPEYNGFVGHVSFVSRDPTKLPWDSKKSGMDPGHPIFKKACHLMAEYASEWRRFAKKAAKNPLSAKPAGERRPTTSERVDNDKLNSDHTQYRTVLPPDFDESACEDKLLRMVREAKALDMGDFAYSSLLVLRTLFELSAINFLRKRKHFADLRQHVFEKQNAERMKSNKEPLSDDFKLHYNPEFDEICDYFVKHGDVWGADDFAHAKSSLEKARSYRRMLNNVAHSPTDIVGVDEAIKVRDATLPLLRHLLSK